MIVCSIFVNNEIVNTFMYYLFLFYFSFIACKGRTPLGMNCGYIATSQLNSSGTYDRTAQYHISQARLAIELGAWRTKYVTGGWIQVLELVFQYFSSLCSDQVYIFVRHYPVFKYTQKVMHRCSLSSIFIENTGK